MSYFQIKKIRFIEWTLFLINDSKEIWLFIVKLHFIWPYYSKFNYYEIFLAYIYSKMRQFIALAQQISAYYYKIFQFKHKMHIMVKAILQEELD